MRLCSIASGSSGNCIYVGDDHTHLLVDTGISKKRIEEGLKELDIKGEELDGILITHEHIDHIQGLGVFSRRYEIPVYATKGTVEGIKSCRSLGSLPEGLLHPVEIDQGFALGGMEVRPFAISHDANEPSGFRIENGKKAVAVATDLGMYDGYTVENLKGLNGVVLEAPGGQSRYPHAGGGTLSLFAEKAGDGRQRPSVQRMVGTASMRYPA